MENFFSNILNVLTDKNISFSRRTIFTISFIFLLFVINDTFNFSFNYRTNQKISQLKNIYEIIPNDSTANINKRKHLHQIENEIINRKPIIAKVKNFTSELISGKGMSAYQINIFYRLLSGLTIYILLALIFPFVEKDKKALKEIFIGIIVIAVSINFLLFLIPTFENKSINYWINLGVSILSLLALAIYGNRKK
ncbi:hypothetical protein [Flavobacterium sp.]|uniref:hypothetical protein n=1 Tax=Flavobacterium sp. TaxID=239 RepID=UPI00391A30BA